MKAVNKLSEVSKIELYEVGDLVYANSKGLEYLSENEDDFLCGYALLNPFKITFVGMHLEDDSELDVIYLVDTIDINPSYHIELCHSECTKEVPQVEDKVVIALPLYTTGAVNLNGNVVINNATIETPRINGNDVIDNYFEQRGQEIGKLVDSKQKAYGNAVVQSYEVLKVFLQPYLHDDGYHIPESLLLHLLIQVRLIDKQNRIFNNPSQDLMEENTYRDMTGYSMLGEKLTNR